VLQHFKPSLTLYFIFIRQMNSYPLQAAVLRGYTL